MVYADSFDGLVPGDSIDVWRYIDYSKLMWIISQGQLHFHRGDCFNDPFEGTVPAIVDEYRQAAYDEEDEFPENMSEIHSEVTKQMRQHTFLNCWHLNDRESAGMWEIYSESNKSIAIKSTVGNLKKAIEDTDLRILMGKVSYLDFHSTNREVERKLREFSNQIPDSASNVAEPFLLKRESFVHESEFRLIHIDPPLLREEDYKAVPYNIEVNGVEQKVPLEVFDGVNQGFFNGIVGKNIEGKNVNVNVDELIDEIRISPNAPSWFTKAVCDTVSESPFVDLDEEDVTSSELEGNPIY